MIKKILIMLLILAVILCGFIFLYNNKPQLGI